ncbi:sigma-70 family RNA polymerase sigma factor [uncultured Paludibaculum sp.]|uniref:sigma-70 family RNA polymerase sigma factor n=1 Tax=uncultured Paludibaculum sp. TaxID=1765020 RepID=UPI002AAC12D7|nr:sigma-70 family RNA polymerase sigma factor [uncultured Paludibaculum sp.]
MSATCPVRERSQMNLSTEVLETLELRPFIGRFLRYGLRGVLDRDDAIQEAGLALLELRHRSKSVSSGCSYLRCSGAACDLRRREVRQMGESIDSMSNSEKDRSPSFRSRAAGPADGALQREARTTLQSALEALPAKDQALLRMHFVQGLRMDEIASRYGVQPPAATKWKSAALARLKVILAARGVESLADILPRGGFHG